MQEIETAAEGQILPIHKPLFWSSFEVVSHFKKLVKPLKIGHAGTLDPMASGLLILCTGKKTKQIESIQILEKEYTGTIKLGASTAGHDLESPEEHLFRGTPPSEEEVREGVNQLTGQIPQVPPQHSAVKIEGMRSYHRLRENIPLDLPVRWVDIYEFEIQHYEWPYLQFRIRCSKGTYIRAIARDLGDMLGCGGYLTALCRTAIGPYTLEHADSSILEWTTGKSRRLKEKVILAHPEITF